MIVSLYLFLRIEYGSFIFDGDFGSRVLFLDSHLVITVKKLPESE